MVLRCTASALDQSEAKGENQQKGNHALNLFRMLAGMLFQELWKHVGKNHDKHNDQDYNCGQGVDGRVEQTKAGKKIDSKIEGRITVKE